MHIGKRFFIRSGFALGGIVLTLVVTFAVLNLLPLEKNLTRLPTHTYAVSNPQFRQQVAAVLGSAATQGNQIHDLENGAQIFPAMLKAIRGAKSSIDLAAYIFWSGQVTRQFVDALDDRARAGVSVHVLVDWIGGRHLDDETVRRLRAAGVQFEYYHPLAWSTLARLNNRTHRRLLIIDGRVAFTGGVGIADSWAGHGRHKNHWRDMQFRLTGPVAAQLQGVFEDNWIVTTGHVLVGPTYYPPLSPHGTMTAQVVSSSPEGGNESMQLMYLMAIEGARSSIDLDAAYFIPDTLVRQALVNAMARGVHVRILLPGKNDAGFVLTASRADWGQMLHAGAKLYQYQPSKFHCKMMIVDQYLTMVGSANFDNRSFKLNDEVDVNVYSHDFAQHMTGVMDDDIGHARRVSLTQYKKRSWTTRTKEWLASLADAQL